MQFENHILQGYYASNLQKTYRKNSSEKKVITVSDVYAKITKKVEIEIKKRRKALKQAKAVKFKRKCKNNCL